MRYSISALLFLILLNSCFGKSVLDIPSKEASRKLERGDFQFVLDAPASRMKEISRINADAPFFTALLLEKSGRLDVKNHIIFLLQEALKSPITKSYAAKKLIALDPDVHFQRFYLHNSVYDNTVWGESFDLLKDISAKKKLNEDISIRLQKYFFSSGLQDSHFWLFDRLKDSVFDDDDEDENKNLIAGRIYASRSAYQNALAAFKKLPSDQIPQIFIEYPELLNDLGKAYQYAGATEGIKKFLEWEKNLPSKKSNVQAIFNTRFRLLFYAGRMARSIKNYKQSVECFEKAMIFAPDDVQTDACIWYVLDASFLEKSESVLPLIKKYAPKWKDNAYFDDILDKVSAWACKNKKWTEYVSIFNSINEYADPEIVAEYAYVIGRAVELGFLERSKDIESSDFYYRKAYSSIEEGASNFVLAIYYRMAAAKRLGVKINFDELFLANNPKKKNVASKDVSNDMQFLNSFFKFGCTQYILPYIRDIRSSLSEDEIRSIAENLQKAGAWRPLINTTIYYMSAKDYKLNKKDLAMRFPQGYKSSIEKYANKAGIEESILFSLIRQESLFDAKAHSHAGAYGLTQLMEKTALEMARTMTRRGHPSYIIDEKIDLFDPEINIHLGSLYYRQLLDSLQSRQNAILAYNGGIGRVKRWKKASSELPDDLFLESVEISETRNYGKSVLGGQAIYEYLYY